MKHFASKKDMIMSFVGCLICSIIMAVGVRIFLVPHDIAAGGFTGIATIINGLNIVPFSVGIIVLLLNIPLFILSAKTLGSRFGLLSIFTTLTYSIALEVISALPFLTNLESVLTDKLLCSIYGASLFGIGLGIIIRTGSSTGGSDMLANLITSKFSFSNIGILIFAIDGSVVLLSAIVFKTLEAPLYAFLVSFFSSKLIDYIVDGGKTSKAFYIFSEKTDELSDAIIKELHRGGTVIKGQGIYTQRERSMILCLVLRTQAPQLKKLVSRIDPKAFLFLTNVSEAFGEGFNKVDKKK